MSDQGNRRTRIKNAAADRTAAPTTRPPRRGPTPDPLAGAPLPTSTGPAAPPSADAGTELVNGLDTKVLGGLIAMLRRHPHGGRATFLAGSRWEDGARVSTRLAGYRIDGELHHGNEREHLVVTNWPVELGATDRAPGPAEQLLSALGSCIASTANAYAALKGIHLTRLEVATEGDADLHGFSGLDAGVRPGLSEIRAEITIGGTADEEALREIALLGYQFSLVRDTIQQGTPVRPGIHVEG